MRNITAPLLIFAYGNPSRGDDALGPQLLDLLGNCRLLHRDWRDFDMLTDFQLQVEHAVDLENRSLVLFIDASESGPSPFRFHSLQPATDIRYTTHEMSPEAVLHVFEKIYHKPAPPAFMLSVRGESFNLGQPLSHKARENCDAALGLLVQLCAEPSVESWQAISAATPA